MAGSPWRWSERAHRYQDTRTGRFLSPNQMAPLRDAFTGSLTADAKAATARLGAQAATLQEWTGAMRGLLRTAYVDQYCMARGGRHAMTPQDWGRVGQALREQYGYLSRFGAELAAGTVSPAKAEQRAALYLASSTRAFEQGKAASHAGLVLPAYPAGEPATPCLTNCKCRWVIVDTPEAWECTWTMSSAEHCTGCLERAETWAPLIVPK